MARTKSSLPVPDEVRAAIAAIAEESITRSARPKTEQEITTERILRTLTELGGQTVGEDSLLFFGDKFILPANMQGKIDDVIEFLQDWDEGQNTPFEFTRTYNYRPYDGAAAFDRAMKRVFGTTGIGKAQRFLFGSIPPQYMSIASGPRGETMQVPWGKVDFSLLDASFLLDDAYSAEYGRVFSLHVEAPKRHRQKIEGFFKVLEDELRTHSIYKGHAVTADAMEPQFIDTSVLDPAKVIYKKEVLQQLNVNLWAPIRYTEVLRANGIPLKRAILLSGPNGTGKTLAGLRSAQICEENGWTYVLVRAGEDPFEALHTARMYAPAVVWIEDLDVIASADVAAQQGRSEISRVLDELDNVQAKGSEVMAGFTTNFEERLDKGVLRPGRLDAVIKIAELDADGYERLVRALVPDALLGEVDFAAVTEAYTDFLPAFATEATQRAVRYSIARNAGAPDKITTDDLVQAAYGMRDHLALMEAAQHGQHEVRTLDTQIEGIVDRTVGSVLEGYLGLMNQSPRRDAQYEIKFEEKSSNGNGR